MRVASELSERVLDYLQPFLCIMNRHVYNDDHTYGNLCLQMELKIIFCINLNYNLILIENLHISYFQIKHFNTYIELFENYSLIKIQNNHHCILK